MQTKLSDDLISISTMMMVARERSEIISLASELNNIIQKAMEIEKVEKPSEKRKALSASIKFTKQEIDKMSKTFKKEFIANGCVAHIIKRPSGKKGVYYEIRYRRNGFNISVSNKDLATAKALFIEETKKLESPKTLALIKTKFETIAYEWLEYKKGKVDNHTAQQYGSRILRFIPTSLKNKQITEIRTNDIDQIISSVETARMREEIRSLYNQIFKYAIASGIISHNPVTLIPFKRAERENRKALTDKQLSAFLKRIKEPKFDTIRQNAYLIYFFGVRPCEIDKEAHFENDFLICRNRKRKGGKIEYKKIPVPKQAQGLIDFEKPIVKIKYNTFLELMKDALGDKLTPYNLRHTFASICAEKVHQEIVEIWMGDSPDKLVGRVYIHYKDEFMRQQMDMINFLI